MDIAAGISLSNLELTRFFIALVLLLLAAHLLGFLFYELKLPRVIGEILGGLRNFSTALKSIGALAVGKMVRQSRLSSVNLAVALNARGGPGIVLASVAFDLRLISETFFVALVLVAIVTSLIAGYWLRYVKGKGWELLQNQGMASKE